MRTVWTAAALALALVSLPRGAALQAPQVGDGATGPRLAVIIVVDQMRTDYITRFRNNWTGGLNRLVREGAWFTNAAYPFRATFTCPGHATIATGAYPRSHGIFQNAWYDRQLGRSVTCTNDPRHKNIGYYDGATDHDSAAALRLPTFADEMRRQKKARVVTLAQKARSAIMLAGQQGDAVTWLAESGRGWETSTAFASAPVPAVKAFIDANPFSADMGKVWERLLPASRYQFPDRAPGERPPDGWASEFPHAMAGSWGDPFLDQWQMSPYADEYLARLALTLVETEKLGQRDTIDFLAISFSAPDILTHAFGPRSQETQDMYQRLDQTIGTLLSRLDALVGRDQYIVGMTSDHGVADIPDQAVAEGRNAGRTTATRLATAIGTAVAGALGIKQRNAPIARISSADVYFEPGIYERLQARPPAMAEVLAALRAQPGIETVFLKEELSDPGSLADERRRAAALSYVEGRSGDMMLTPIAGWVITVAATSHGSSHPYDQRVPLILMGPGIRPGEYAVPASPADLSPTLAALVGISMPTAEGRPLTIALSSGRSPSSTLTR
jgi:predicted AlkP superfamily pyrophosphatase or phosphodiesterase